MHVLRSMVGLMRGCRVLAVVALGLAVGAGCSRKKELTLRNVVLYQNGIGYFEHEGVIKRDVLRIHVRQYEINDLLKTLTVIGGESDDEAVATTTVSTSVEKKTRAKVSRGKSPKHALHENDKNATDDADRRAVDVHLHGAVGRRVTVAYAVPTPAWRPTYRLVLAGEGKSLLQGWAAIQNTGDDDWKDVKLTLATGAPLSFAVDLDSPQFVARPDLTGQMIKPSALGTVMSSRSKNAEVLQEHDRDGDRILDVDDKCPDEPETYNGVEDEDG